MCFNRSAFLALLACFLSAGFADLRDEFSINTRVIEEPFRPHVSIPADLLVRFQASLARYSRSSDPAPKAKTQVSESLCPSSPHKRRACCGAVFLSKTLQEKQCLSATGARQRPPFDPLNVPDEKDSRSCIMSSKRCLRRCCYWLKGGNSSNVHDVKQCERVRINIVTRGMRVCTMDDVHHRFQCCRSVFAARPMQIKQCQAGVPVYVDRRAPCVFRRDREQAACCAQLFPTSGDSVGIRPYHLCRRLVQASSNRQLHCAEKYPRSKCCQEQKLFGRGAYISCLKEKQPRCRHPNFFDRLECCKSRHSVSSKKFDKCLSYRYYNCQHHDWRDRLTCCAMLFRIGSRQLHRCVYFWMAPKRLHSLEEYWGFCQEEHALGSRSFELCVLHPFYVCRSSVSDGASRKHCCERMFKSDAIGQSMCSEGEFSEQEVLEKYGEVVQEEYETLSNRTKEVRYRVEECNTNFRRWSQMVWMACLSEMIFTVREGKATHFLLFATNDTRDHVENACAIHDAEEREACCRLHYAEADSQLDVCMGWKVEKFLGDLMEDEGEGGGRGGATEELMMRTLMNSVSVAEEKMAKDGEVSRLVDRQVLSRFLIVMKMLEDDRSEDEGGMPKRLKRELTRCFNKFQKAYRAAVGEERVAIFWVVGQKDWAGCVTVGLEGRDRDEGIMYCGMLGRMAGKETVPRRKPKPGWEAGAFKDLLSNGNMEVTARLSRHGRGWVWNRGGSFSRTSSGTVYQERYQRSAYGSSYGSSYDWSWPTSSSRVIVVTLFGSCSTLHQGYVCHALCCDDYYAFSGACNSVDMQCVG